MVRQRRGLVGVLVVGLVLAGTCAAGSASTQGGIPLGGTPVDVGVMGDGRVVVLMEAVTEQAWHILDPHGIISSETASLLVFNVGGDGRIWPEAEVVLYKEAATRTPKADVRGFDIFFDSFAAVDPSHLVIAGHEEGDEDRVFVISHRFGGIYDVEIPRVLDHAERTGRSALSLLNWRKFLSSRDVGDLILVVGDPFMAVGDLDTDGINDVVVVTPADRQVRVLPGEGEGDVGHRPGQELAALLVGARGDEPRAVDLVDLSRHADFPELALVVAHGGILSDEVSLVISGGDGVVVLGPSMSATGTPRAAIAGDFTNNGIPDLVVVGAEAFVFLRGLHSSADGFPAFGMKEPGGAVSIPEVRDYPGRVGLVAADFNLDGNLDLAIANVGGGTVDVWHGNGDGTFTRRQRMAMGEGARPIALAATDISGNGMLDLLVLNQGTNELVVRMGRGNGTFYDAPSVAELIHFPGRLFAVGDLNGSGGNDLVRALFAGVDVGPDAASGISLLESESGVAHKYTRTEEGEAVVERLLHFRNQDGIEAFPTSISGTARAPIRMVPEAPGRLEAGSASLSTREGRGTLVEMWPGLEGAASAEEWLTQIQNEHNDFREAGFVPRTLLELDDDHYPYPRAISVGDILGDGLDEVVILDSLNRHLVVLKWFEAQVTNPIQVLFDYPIPFPWSHPLPTTVVLADLVPDCPGKEIVVLNARSDSALVFCVDVDHAKEGRAQLTTRVLGHGSLPEGSDPVAGIALPAEGGGDDLLVVADYATNVLHLFTPNDTPPGRANAPILDHDEVRVDGLNGPIDLAAARFGDEGIQHVAVAYHGSSRIVVFARRGQTLQEAVEPLTIEGRPYSVAVGDFDHDGLQDIAVVSSAGLEIFFGNPDLTFERCFARTPEQLGGLPLWVGSGDFNGDGHADLVVSVGRFNEYGLAVHGLAYDDVWSQFGPIERECEE